MATAAVSSGPTLALYPPVVALRDGRTEARLRLHARDSRARPIDLNERRVRFRSDRPGLVSVNAEGLVRAAGYGHAVIEATVAGLRGRATARIRVGSSKLDPPLLYLDPEGPDASRRLRWLAWNADGSPFVPDPAEVAFECGGCDDPGAPVEMEPGGLFRARRPTRSLAELAVVRARWRGDEEHDTARVLVLHDPIPGRRPVSLRGDRVEFLTHPRLGGVDLLDVWDRFQALRVTDLGHEILTELNGVATGDGDRLLLAHGIAQRLEMWQCGSASVPIWLGTRSLLRDFGNSCFVDGASGAPAWGVLFHEMGHTFGGGRRFSQGFAMTRDPNDPYLSHYGEDFASLQATIVGAMLRQRARRYDLPRRIVRSVLDHWGTHWNDTDTLDQYVADGADYYDIPGGPGGIFRGMMWTLAQEYGWGAIYRFYSIFLPLDAEFSFAALGVEERATFFAAALSAATGDDLLSRFRDDWGFPVEGPLYRRMLREMIPAAALRDPVVEAGPNQRVRAGQALRLLDASATDWEDDPMRYRWRIVEAPADGQATLEGSRRLHARFRAEHPGDYVLALRAGDDLLQRQDTVRVRVLPRAGG